MGTKGEIYRLLTKKKEIEQKIIKLQKECKHSIKSIKFVSIRPDGYQTETRWICDDCEKVLGIPGPEDLNRFLTK